MAAFSSSTSDMQNTGVATFGYMIKKLQETSGDMKTPDSSQQLARFLDTSLQQLLPEKKNLKDVTHEDIIRNPQLKDIFSFLSTLGERARSDLQKCNKLPKNESKIIGLSGTPMDSNHKQMDTTDDGTSILEPLEDRLGSLNISVQNCKAKIQKLNDWPLTTLLAQLNEIEMKLKSYIFSVGMEEAQLTEHHKFEKESEELVKVIIEELQTEGGSWNLLEVSANCLCETMALWRKVEAWRYATLITVPENYVSTLYSELDIMFGSFFESLQSVENKCSIFRDGAGLTIKAKIKEIKNKVLEVAWCYEQQPHTCYLICYNMDLSVRLFGLTQSMKTGLQSKLYFFPERDHEKWFTEKYLWGIIKDFPDSKETRLSVKGIKLTKPSTKNCKGDWVCQQFYRLCFAVECKTDLRPNNEQTNVRPNIECMSLPFTIRTAANKFWECEGMVKAYCFTATDLYATPLNCKKEMSIPQVLSMLQALVSSEIPDKIFDKDEIQALGSKLQTLTKTDKINLTDLVKNNMPWSGRRHGEKNKVSFFNWFMAALKTLKQIPKDDLGMMLSPFLSADQCSEKVCTAPEGSAMIRISQNKIRHAWSQEPFADIAIHINIGERKDQIQLLRAEELKNFSLKCHLARYKDWNKQKLIKCILPSTIPMDWNYDGAVNVNGHQSMSTKFPGDIIIERCRKTFEKININSSFPEAEDDSLDEVPEKVTRSCSGQDMNLVSSPTSIEELNPYMAVAECPAFSEVINPVPLDQLNWDSLLNIYMK